MCSSDLLVFRGQRITEEQQLTFAANFGGLGSRKKPPESLRTHAEGSRQDNEKILLVSNIVEDGEPIGLADAGSRFEMGITTVPTGTTINAPTVVTYGTQGVARLVQNGGGQFLIQGSCCGNTPLTASGGLAKATYEILRADPANIVVPFTVTSSVSFTQATISANLAVVGTATVPSLNASIPRFNATTLTTTVNAAPTLTITTQSLPYGSVGQPYNARVTATGGTGTYTWTLVGSAAPSGLLFGTTGVFSGSPLAGGTTTLRVAVQDQAGQTAFANLVLSIPQITNTTLPGAAVGSPYVAAINVTDGPSGMLIAATGLPNGMIVSNGQITGTPTQAGNYSVTVTATGGGATATKASLASNSARTKPGKRRTTPEMAQKIGRAHV